MNSQKNYQRLQEVLEELKIKFIYLEKENLIYLPEENLYFYNSEKTLNKVLSLSQKNDAEFTTIFENGRIAGHFGEKFEILYCKDCKKFYFAHIIVQTEISCPHCKSKDYDFITQDGCIPNWNENEEDEIHYLFDKYEFEKKCNSLENDKKSDFLAVTKKLEGQPKIISINDQKIKDVKNLTKNFPNVIEVVEYILQSLKLIEFRKDKAISFRPILLVGNAGCGKTSFAIALCKILLGRNALKIDLGNNVSSLTLAGTDSLYSDAKPGIIAESMYGDNDGSPTQNPIIIFDELDKIQKRNSDCVEPVFYSLLEKGTAKYFYENFLGMNIDASGINYIFTANSIENIPQPLLNRLKVFHIPDYTEENFRSCVLDSFYNNWIETNNLRPEVLPEVLSEEIKTKIIEISKCDARSVNDAINDLFFETTIFDEETNQKIALFSQKELENGWQNFCGKQNRKKWKFSKKLLHKPQKEFDPVDYLGIFS